MKISAKYVIYTNKSVSWHSMVQVINSHSKIDICNFYYKTKHIIILSMTMRVLKLSATNCMKNRISQRCPQLVVARIYKLCM